jgi:tRNA modification GTPase
LARVMQRTSQGALLREGIKVVIAGQPNAGKSSLLNALAGAELAIVTPIAGTTRDKVQQTIQIDGVPLHIIDTAGLRHSEEDVDLVEKIGIERAWAEIENADAVLFLHDLQRLHDIHNPEIAIKYIADEAIITPVITKLAAKNVPIIDVWNKADAVAADIAAQHKTVLNDPNSNPQITISAKQGTGLDELRQTLLHIAGWQPAAEGVYIARERHVQALRQVSAHLDLAESQLRAKSQALDLLAEELRLAQNDLSAITGEFTSDDLLGVIFSKFCIGK